MTTVHPSNYSSCKPYSLAIVSTQTVVLYTNSRPLYNHTFFMQMIASKQTVILYIITQSLCKLSSPCKQSSSM